MATNLPDNNVNEAEIRGLVENWAKAVRNGDIDAIPAHHSEDIVMYDVPEPFLSVGIDAYRKTWVPFFAFTNQEGLTLRNYI
jgi:ketosteroid isomerase-like protein